MAAGRPLVCLKPKYRQAERGGAAPGMKTSVKSAVWPAVILIVLLLCLWLLLDVPWLLGADMDIDINSADTRHQVRVLSLTVKTEIEESVLSREVRRLGINIPPTRVWKPTYEGHLTNENHISYRYGSILAMCHHLMSILDQAKAPDEERRAILETLMKTLRKGDPRKTQEETFLLMAEVAERHDMQVFVPEFMNYITRLRDAR